MAADVAALVERCRQGDDLAWERLVRSCQGRVYALAYHYLGGVEQARDLTQEVFVRVYQQLGTYKGDGFMAWLLRITRNLCIDQMRRQRARPPAEDLVAEDNEWALPDTAPDPEQSWLRDGKKRLVYDALRRLNGPSREMILLKEIQGLQLKEIAEMLGVPIGTVKSRSNRARVELARQVIAIDPSYANQAES
ncbi:MAG: sigma-70 family RNA polymerase sigma factor [Acidobacteria bacterium]|nr:sigma-70 family RNA polymerase sigma factor [Acidobacteriota bacterium]